MMAALGHAVVFAVDQCETFGATSLEDVSLTVATRRVHALRGATATVSALRGCSALFGGVSIAGTQGRCLGVLDAALLLTLLAGATLPYSARTILFSIVVFLAIMALRDRRLSETS